MAATGKKRVLFIGHDNILAGVEDLEVDFLGGLGRNMGRAKGRARGDRWSAVLSAAWRVVTRGYDQVILPSALLTRAAESGGSRLKRVLARLLFHLSYREWCTRLCRACSRFLLRGRPAAFLERFEQTGVHRPLFQFFADSILFKTVTHRSNPRRDRLRVVPTPWWLNLDWYPALDLVPFEERSIDVFFAGAMSSTERMRAPEFERLAKEAGIGFHWQRDPLEFEAFIERLAQSKVAWSPEGSNWHCWRHYEALYYGAIPLINRPDSRIFHTLNDGKTCFLYDSPEHAIELMKEICLGKLRLSMEAEERREFVVREHSADGVGRMIARELGLIGEEDVVPGRTVPATGDLA